MIIAYNDSKLRVMVCVVVCCVPSFFFLFLLLRLLATLRSFNVIAFASIHLLIRDVLKEMLLRLHGKINAVRRADMPIRLFTYCFIHSVYLWQMQNSRKTIVINVQVLRRSASIPSGLS